MPLISAIFNPTLVNGFILGWSVAWPPGPINAEMIRRGLRPHAAGGGFWSAWRLGLGACSGDFLWALGVTAGAGTLVNTPTVRLILGVVSLALLLFLAFTYSVGAWRTARQNRTESTIPEPTLAQLRNLRSPLRGYVLGLTLALASPWNIGFWFAVIGGQQSSHHGFSSSLALAAAVVLGAVAWTLVLCIAVKQGARIFARPSWQITTQALTALVMLFFALKLALQLR
jgi:threonine/homoserine/homoserine lactone efflux protein